GDKEGVDRFIKRVGTPERAKDILGQRISSELGALIGKTRMDDLIVVDEKTVAQPGQRGKAEKTLELLRQRLLTGQDTNNGDPEPGSLLVQARNDYGIELVDIRLRRFNHPASVRDAIFERIKQERKTRKEKYINEGITLADNIKNKASSDAKKLTDKALAEKKKLLEGDAFKEATALLSK